jgi:two-component system, cell cycle sensor histidine kinase and response regulator CckA
MNEPSRGLLFAAHPQPMWVYDLETLAFLEVNDAAVECYGYSRDAFLGAMRVTDLRPPDDVERVLDDVERMRTADGAPRRSRHLLQDGRVINVEIASHRLEFRGRPSALVVVHDVTDHQRIEAALRRGEERLLKANAELEERVRQRTAELQAAVERLQRSEARSRSLIEGAAYGIYRATAGGVFIEVNPALVDMLGYGSPEELVGLGATVGIYQEPAVRAALVDECSRFGRVDGVEVRWRRKDGGAVTVKLSARAVADERGRIVEFEVIAEDVTERRRLEDQLRQAQKMDAIGQLAGGIAHNFNNLLMSILGYAELLLVRGGIPEADREDLEEIQKAGERASVLTRQLLAFSRKQQPVPCNVDLNQTVTELRRMLVRLIREDISITCELGDAPAAIQIDPHELEQVVLNLVLNARDALVGGGRIHLEVARIVIGEHGYPSLAPGEYVRLRVVDNGVGMSEEIRAHLFEPFFTTKEPGKGTGLGLASVYGIVRQAGGVISVASAPGQGSTFTIHFPALSVSDTGDAATPHVAPAATARGHETILVVEDEDAVREIISTALEQHGYRVLAASRPSMASRMFDEHVKEIDLLLTDVVMPEMDGPTLASTLVAKRPGLQTLYISGYAEGGSLGAGDPRVSFLSKPVQPSVLASKVREMLDRARTDG